MSLPNPAQIEAFPRDGVVLLKGVFGDRIETLCAGVERYLAEPGPFGREYPDDNRQGSCRASGGPR